MQQRLFTVDEANALIPKLEIIMGRLQRQGLNFRQEVEELVHQTKGAEDELSTAQIIELRPHLQPLVEEIEVLLEQLDSLGVEMKGLDLGLIDFPAEIEGEVVLLCWQFGEKEVGYYHTLEAGFAGRKPLHPNAERPRILQ